MDDDCAFVANGTTANSCLGDKFISFYLKIVSPESVNP